MNRTEKFLQNLHGVDPSVIRDWNDEYQSIRELPKKDLIQRLNCDKLMVKVLSDFTEAAIEVINFIQLATYNKLIGIEGSC